MYYSREIKKNVWIEDRNNSSKINIGNFVLRIHHYYGCGDALFVTVSGIFDKKELTVTNIEKAKIKALELLHDELQSGTDGIDIVLGKAQQCIIS